VAIDHRNENAGDPTRGTGPDKITQAVEPDLDARPDAQANEASDSSAADPARGGCMRFGWGCLPVISLLLLVPAGLLS
jgi:hypothetical protein